VLERFEVWLSYAVFEFPLEQVDFVHCGSVEREDIDELWARHGLTGNFEK
jgi:hypothetical protein